MECRGTATKWLSSSQPFVVTMAKEEVSHDSGEQKKKKKKKKKTEAEEVDGDAEEPKKKKSKKDKKVRTLPVVAPTRPTLARLSLGACHIGCALLRAAMHWLRGGVYCGVVEQRALALCVAVLVAVGGGRGKSSGVGGRLPSRAGLLAPGV
jgi:hypothetical protein